MTRRIQILLWGPVLSGKHQTVARLSNELAIFDAPMGVSAVVESAGIHVNFFRLAPFTPELRWTSIATMRNDRAMAPLLAPIRPTGLIVIFCLDAQEMRLEANQEALDMFQPWAIELAEHASFAMLWNKIDLATATSFDGFASAARNLPEGPLFRTSMLKNIGINPLRCWLKDKTGWGVSAFRGFFFKRSNFVVCDKMPIVAL